MLQHKVFHRREDMTVSLHPTDQQWAFSISCRCWRWHRIKVTRNNYTSNKYYDSSGDDHIHGDGDASITLKPHTRHPSKLYLWNTNICAMNFLCTTLPPRRGSSDHQPTGITLRRNISGEGSNQTHNQQTKMNHCIQGQPCGYQGPSDPFPHTTHSSLTRQPCCLSINS